MEWLRFTDLERSYGARHIFSEVSGVLADGAKVGLVGQNGAGKSSLVRILAGLEKPDHGTLVRAAGSRSAYLDQRAADGDERTLGALLAEAFRHGHELEAEVRRLETALGAAEGDEAERLLRAYGEARDAYDRHGGEDGDRRMRAMLEEFGFSPDDLTRPAEEFSGGQRTRAALARVFLEDPDYFILDEPTNHLDLETIRRLEDFLIADSRAALIVSHDRGFLDRVATEIWEIERGKLERYVVPRGRAYEAYVEEKQRRYEQAERDYAKFKDEERRRKAVIAELRTHGSHNYSHVRSREKQLGKLEEVDAPEAPRSQVSVDLKAARRATTGRALQAKALSAAYQRPLFTGLDFELTRGERIALVGPNGAGKSTLLDVLAGRREPDAGSVRIMDGVRYAYFSQDSADELPAGVTAVDAVRNDGELGDEAARSLLGRMGLTGDAGDKLVDEFSGGERRRIMLARLMARAADLLFLDEPTNDLDIPSREALEEVLAGYGGAMVVVSHDRYLLRRLANKVLWLRDGQASTIEGGYERFETFAAAPQAAPPPKAERGPSQAALEREERQRRDRHARELKTSEREAERLDAERAKLEAAFADPAIYDDAARVADLRTKLEAAQRAADAAFARWEALSNVSP